MDCSTTSSTANARFRTLFDERLTFIQAADEAGFYCLQLAEHHATPLNMVPVPGVFLGAVARLTKRIKIGRWSICCRSTRRCA